MLHHRHLYYQHLLLPIVIIIILIMTSSVSLPSPVISLTFHRYLYSFVGGAAAVVSLAKRVLTRQFGLPHRGSEDEGEASSPRQP